MRNEWINKIASNEKMWIVGLWIVSFLLHVVIVNHFNGWICSDTAGYWLHAATFTGHDWSEVASTTSMYYSWGYSLLLMIPFLLFPNNMIAMSRIAIVINSFLCSLVFVFLYLLGKKIFKETRRRYRMAGAFLVSVYPTYILESSVALSESLLFFLYVFELWLITQYLDSAKIKWAVMSGLCCGYMYIVHHRTLGIVFAFACMLGGMYRKHRNWKEILWFVLPVFVCFAFSVVVDDWLMAKESAKNIYSVNTYGAMAKKTSVVMRIGGILSIVQNVIGELWYLLTGTFTAAGLGILFFLKKIRRKESVVLSELMIFAILSLLFSILISAMSMPRRAESPGSRIDLIFYGRYIENVLSIFILAGFIGFSELGKKKETLKEEILLIVSMISTSVFVHYFTLMIAGKQINYFSVTAVLTLYSYPNLEFSVLAASICNITFSIVLVWLFLMDKQIYRMAAYGLIAGIFLYTGYSVVVNLDNSYKGQACASNYPTQNQEVALLNNYIEHKGIHSFGVYLENNYDAFSYQLMNPQKKVYAFSSMEDLHNFNGTVTHVIIPQSFKETMTVERLEMETENYAIYSLSEK